MLDNWYLVDPINQRGKSSYNPGGYCIDRYINSGGVFTINEGFCTWSTNRDNSFKRFRQYLGFSFEENVTYTLSILAKINAISGNTTLRPSYINGAVIENFYGFDILQTTSNYEVFLYSFTPTTEEKNVAVELLVRNSTNEYVDIDIKAIKLEKGLYQTLAHKDSNNNWILNNIPNKTIELLKCQKYLQTLCLTSINPSSYNINVKSVTYCFNFPIVMRSNATLLNPEKLKFDTNYGIGAWLSFLDVSLNVRNGLSYDLFCHTEDTVSTANFPAIRFHTMQDSISQVGPLYFSAEL